MRRQSPAGHLCEICASLQAVCSRRAAKVRERREDLMQGTTRFAVNGISIYTFTSLNEAAQQRKKFFKTGKPRVYPPAENRVLFDPQTFLVLSPVELSAEHKPPLPASAQYTTPPNNAVMYWRPFPGWIVL